jgi:GT2 family glycosyltransferase
MMKKGSKVSIILLTFNSSDYLKSCIKSLKRISYKNTEIIVIDNASTDNSLDISKKLLGKAGTKFILNKVNFGYAKAINIAVAKASGKYVLILNPDTVVTSNFLEPLVEAAELDRSVAAVQPAVYLMRDKNF